MLYLKRILLFKNSYNNFNTMPKKIKRVDFKATFESSIFFAGIRILCCRTFDASALLSASKKHLPIK